MYFLNFLTFLASVLALTEYVCATLRITADHFSFGGVNFPGLQCLEPKKREQAITALVKSNARVIRLFISGAEGHPDVETQLGVFDNDLLDIFDDTLAAIHRIGKGKVKVIIAPHDAHALRATNNLPCDVYCELLEGHFLDFYSIHEIRDLYKQRLTELFINYKSKNFNGASWNSLNNIILGVDLQNEPWSAIWPIVAGEGWICDIATFMKEKLHFGKNNIAVITGGLSGAQLPGGTQNFPDSAFDCEAVDVIAIHGYYGADEESSAGKSWAQMFIPGNTLTSRALGKKLIIVEEMTWMGNKFGLHYKKPDIWDQGNALNYRGIPWLYSKATTGSEGKTGNINVLFPDVAAIGALKDVLTRAYTSRSNFDWSTYLPPPKALSNLTHMATNPFIHASAPCTFGCLGWLCDSSDGCTPDLLCKNNVCTLPTEKTLGAVGSECNSHKKHCQEHLQCINGVCSECVARTSKPQAYKKGKQPKPTIAGSVTGTCELDDPFTAHPYCQFCDHNTSNHSCRGNPCLKASDCSASEFCDWGLCKPCVGKGCLGTSCKSSRACKTGYCNNFGKCDYASDKVKRPLRPEDFTGRRGPGSPRFQVKGPSKPMDNVVRVNIPKEKVMETGKAETVEFQAMETGKSEL